MSEQRSNTPWIVVAVLGGLGCLGLLVVAPALGALLYLVHSRAAPTSVAWERPSSTRADEPASGADDPNVGSIPAEIEVETNTDTYLIAGASAEALKGELARLGPKDQDGSHHAYTRWHVRWSYPYDRGAGSCGIGPAKVSVAVTFTLPSWNPPAEAPSELVERWNTHIRALERHENGHKQHGLGAARDVLVTLRQLEAQPDCDSMNRAANAAASRVVDDYKAKDKAFDLATRHGATQGARFP